MKNIITLQKLYLNKGDMIMARPRKYLTEEDRRLARNSQAKTWRESHSTYYLERKYLPKLREKYPNLTDEQFKEFFKYYKEAILPELKHDDSNIMLLSILIKKQFGIK